MIVRIFLAVACCCCSSLCNGEFLSAQTPTPTLEEQLIAEPRSSLAADIKRDGNPNRGAAVFYARAIACSTCHSLGDRTTGIGPDLAQLGLPVSTDEQLIEAVLEPSKTISPNYATVLVQTISGETITGLPVDEDEEKLVLRDASQSDRLVTILKDDIDARRPATVSLMPGGQINQLANRQQFLDLMRFLMEVRDGGPERAKALQPPPNPLAQKVPDDPRPWQPVVQRGEIELANGEHYPHGVAMGFVGGTILFDANQLRTVAVWPDGFVKSSPQHYFGLFWHQDGGQAQTMSSDPQLLSFQFPDQPEWQTFEPTKDSGLNGGSRFDGYQIGQSSVRLRYHLLVQQQRIEVSETVRWETRPHWHGHVREFKFIGLPKGARVRLALPSGENPTFFSSDGKVVDQQPPVAPVSNTPLLLSQSDGANRVIHVRPEAGVNWDNRNVEGVEAVHMQRIVSARASDQPVVIRVDCWTSIGKNEHPQASKLLTLANDLPQLDDSFDRPVVSKIENAEVTGSSPNSSGTALAPPAKRPAVSPQKNMDEFPPVSAKFLRFTILRTSDGLEPGIDELEIYGSDPTVNLALTGTASASSSLANNNQHQVRYLNDGKTGNESSWLSNEAGGGWARIEFAEPVEVQKVVWARDQTGGTRTRLATSYQIEVSNNGDFWTQVSNDNGRELVGDAIGSIRPDAAFGYLMEQIPAPFPTWRPADIAFGDDGMMYVIAMTEGQIWRSPVPPAEHPEQVQWQRYATGLFHPVGLASLDGRLFVAQKPEITELIDRNGDGTVDHYRTVATGWGLSTGWHEYCFGLAVDAQRNLWFALNTGNFWTHPGFVNPGRWRGSIMRVDYQTESLEIVATGCRVPNGLARGPNDEMFFTDNQGDWIQSCKLACIVPGRFYGHPETKADQLPTGSYPDGLSSVWMPYKLSRSSSGPVCDRTEGKFGPFDQQMFVGDVGYGVNTGIMRVALEKVDGEYQGAVFRFIDNQPLGCERLKFGPDQQLYSTSLTSGLTRLRFDGKTPFALHSLHLRPQGVGFDVKLTRPLAAEITLRPEQFTIKRFHYLYSGQYGSEHVDEQPVAIKKIELSADRKTIKLSFPVETYPIGMVYEFNLGELADSDGNRLTQNEAWYTVHKIPQ